MKKLPKGTSDIPKNDKSLPEGDKAMVFGEGTFIETVAEGSKTDSFAQKNKGKEKASPNLAKAVEFEGPKVHRPVFIYRGQAMLASASPLKSANVSYSILSCTILLADEEELLGISEVKLEEPSVPLPCQGNSKLRLSSFSHLIIFF